MVRDKLEAMMAKKPKLMKMMYMPIAQTLMTINMNASFKFKLDAWLRWTPLDIDNALKEAVKALDPEPMFFPVIPGLVTVKFDFGMGLK